MTTTEITVYNAGRRLFDQASEPVSLILASGVVPIVWLTPDELQAARRLQPDVALHWVSRGFHDAARDDVTADTGV